MHDLSWLWDYPCCAWEVQEAIGQWLDVGSCDKVRNVSGFVLGHRHCMKLKCQCGLAGCITPGQQQLSEL